MSRKVVLVTGAASGMGEAVARKYLELGDRVVGFSLEETAGIIHPNFTYVRGDITKLEDCERAAAAAAEKYGMLDTLVNCAGVVKEGNLETTDASAFQKVMQINAGGTFNICKASIPYLKKQPSSIVLIASDMGAKPLNDRIAYNPSKAAVIMLMKCIALDYAPMVRCNAVLPGIIDTPMIQNRLRQSDHPEELMKIYESLYPMGRIGKVEDIVNGVLFLNDDASAWITGIELPICGGPI